MPLPDWLRNLWPFVRTAGVTVFTDGAIRPEAGVSGLAAVVQDADGRVRHSWRQPAGPLTCNEAEYAAAQLALIELARLGVRTVDLYSDSQVLVHQMQGLAAANAPALRQAQARLRGLVQRFQRVHFHHIPREQNRLADALANQAADQAAQQRRSP